MFTNLPSLLLPGLPQLGTPPLTLVRYDAPESLYRLGVEHFALTGPYALTLLQCLRAHAQAHCLTPAGPTGYDIVADTLSNEHSGLKPARPVGSLRVRCFNEQLASILYQALSKQVLRYLVNESPEHCADLDGHGHWEFVGVNPLFRFIRYPAKTGTLVAHYDAPYVADTARRTLYSLLVYLSDCQEGATRFLIDPQSHLAESQRNFKDWDRVGGIEEVRARIPCKQGDVLLFPHRLLHDSEPNDSEKIVMRSDLMFQKVITP